MDATILGSVFTAAMYAAALFGFHMFELIPVARGTVFEQMQEGVLVLDRRRRVVDLNPAAARILGTPADAGPRRRRARPAAVARRRGGVADGPGRGAGRRSSSARAARPAATPSSCPPCGTGAASSSATWSSCTT